MTVPEDCHLCINAKGKNDRNDRGDAADAECVSYSRDGFNCPVQKGRESGSGAGHPKPSGRESILAMLKHLVQ
jgi:hypothetical protein